jgi:hypothetical protein
MTARVPADVAAKRRLEIFVNNRPVFFLADTATGAEIKARADIPHAFHLYGPAGEPIEDHERVRLHEGEHFTAISGHDVS